MSTSQRIEPKAIRLVFELARADNPRLFDELNQFPQGQKRVLAYDGLLAKYGVFSLPAQASGGPAAAPGVGVRSAPVTNGILEPALGE